ncbi:hypothetical protein BH10BDE1_BH10BDE1_03470 [soil metagenome]
MKSVSAVARVALLVSVMAFFSVSVVSAAVLPKEAAQLIQTSIPGAKMVNVTACELGLAKTPSFALIALKKVRGLTDEDVVPMIAMKVGKVWRITPLDKGVNTDGAFIKSFTDEAVEKNVFNKDYRIRCVQPKRGEEIGDHLGKYIQAGLSDDTLKKSKHLCFQASMVYNSWVCFNFEEKVGQIKQSFGQFMAD